MTALLTTEEAATRLHVCTKVVGQLRRAGKLRYVAVTDRKFMYRPEHCDAYLAERERIAQPAAVKPPQPRRRQSGNVHALRGFSERLV